MITLNIVVSVLRRDEVYKLESDNFRIIHSSKEFGGGLHYFNIETTEEDATLLTLKFGKENVWKR